MITCTRITDWSVASWLIQEQWDKVSEDDAQPQMPDTLNEYWLGIWENGQFAGAFRVSRYTNSCYECHACIRSGFRNLVQYCYHAYKWLLENIPGIQVLTCRVPSFKRGAVKLAMKAGFEFSGSIPQSFIKHGTAHSLETLFIRREQMEDVCHRQFQQD